MSGWVLSLRRSGRRRGCAVGDGTVAAASGKTRIGQRYQEARFAEGKRKLVAETDRRRRGDGVTRRRPSCRRSTTRIPWPSQSPLSCHPPHPTPLTHHSITPHRHCPWFLVTQLLKYISISSQSLFYILPRSLLDQTTTDSQQCSTHNPLL